jgi:hypothetical protein
VRAVLILALLLLVVASAGAATKELWRRNNVECWPTGKGKNRGVACELRGSKRIVVVNQQQIIVARGNHVIFLTNSH